VRFAGSTAVGDVGDVGDVDSVVVSVGTREVHPASFTVAVRLRAFGRSHPDRDVVLNGSCVVRLLDANGDAAPIDDAVRDELIAMEHAARHVN
jgi:hypothetical protein